MQCGEHFLKGTNFSFKTNFSFQTNFSTGFPSYGAFASTVAFCSAVLPASKTLSPADVFLLIMMKLRLNRLSQDLAHRFNISCSAVCRLLNVGHPAIAKKLSFLVRWHGNEEGICTLPSVFKRSFRKCRVVTDWTEIFCERSRHLK